MKNLLTLMASAAKDLRAAQGRTDAAGPHLSERQAAAAQLYIYRLRHHGASIDEVAADLGVSPCTLRSWVHAGGK